MSYQIKLYDGKFNIKHNVGRVSNTEFREMATNGSCYSINFSNREYAAFDKHEFSLRMWWAIQDSQHIKRLVMRYHRKFIDIEIDALASNKSITYLDISGTQTGGFLSKVLFGMTQLTTLVIVDCKLTQLEEEALLRYPNLEVIRDPTILPHRRATLFKLILAQELQGPTKRLFC